MSFHFIVILYLTVWGVEPVVTHQTSWLECTSVCGNLGCTLVLFLLLAAWHVLALSNPETSISIQKRHTVRPQSKHTAAHGRAAGQDSTKKGSSQTGVCKFAHTCNQVFNAPTKDAKDKQKQQQPACWYNNVCSQFVVDATLTINNKI